MPSVFQANAQLLGSGRGLVGSDRRGVLEEAAMAPGIVLEVADLDHAGPEVRAGIADLFLGLLELGQGQTAKGPKFSAAGIVLVFTLNLPAGRDEKLHRTFGFGGPPESNAILDEARDELSQLFSRAFLSRIGTPIVYAPLDGDALGGIIERAMCDGIVTAAQRLNDGPVTVQVSEAAVRAVRDAHHGGGARLGARALLETSRERAVDIYLSRRACTPALGNALLIDLRAGELVVTNHPD
jgi:ATP-dependent Clp protease ATP-binding subunit ClpA